MIDHLQEWAVESETATGWAWKPLPYEGSQLVSKTTQIFAAALLATGRCALPTLREAFVAHRFYPGDVTTAFQPALSSGG